MSCCNIINVQQTEKGFDHVGIVLRLLLGARGLAFPRWHRNKSNPPII